MICGYTNNPMFARSLVMFSFSWWIFIENLEANMCLIIKNIKKFFLTEVEAGKWTFHIETRRCSAWTGPSPIFCHAPDD